MTSKGEGESVLFFHLFVDAGPVNLTPFMRCCATGKGLLSSTILFALYGQYDLKNLFDLLLTSFDDHRCCPLSSEKSSPPHNGAVYLPEKGYGVLFGDNSPRKGD